MLFDLIESIFIGLTSLRVPGDELTLPYYLHPETHLP